MSRLPTREYSIVFLYILGVILFKWWLFWDFRVVLFLIGAIVGLHLLPVVADSFGLKSSIFQNSLVQLVLTLVTIFILTSTNSLLGKAVALFLNLHFLYLTQTEFNKSGLASWFVGLVETRKFTNYKGYLVIVWSLFIIETVLFIYI